MKGPLLALGPIFLTVEIIIVLPAQSVGPTMHAYDGIILSFLYEESFWLA